MANKSIYTVGGTVQASGGLYISRKADDELLELCRNGTFAYILSSRQLGKSSLMVRTAERLLHEGITSVIVDLNQIGAQVTAEEWYLGLLSTISQTLDLPFNTIYWWRSNNHLGVTQRLNKYFQEILLSVINTRIIIFVDEIDTTLNLSFTDDFFAAIRYLYNARGHIPKLRQLSFVLIGVATPSDLIRDPKRTPFNIGQRVDVTDWKFEEALPLADGLGLSKDDERQMLKWILKWTGGHPYLTQRLCRAIRDQDKSSWSEFEVDSIVDSTFFGAMSEQDSNLQFVRNMLTKWSPDLINILTTYRDIHAEQHPIHDEERSLVKSHLKLSGIVRRENNLLRVRNLIYREAFNEAWISSHLNQKDMLTVPTLNAKRRHRIFIGHRRGIYPDEVVAMQVFAALNEHHDVFIDRSILVGSEWAERMENELRNAEFLIVFLSAQAINSEMIKLEIETGYQLFSRIGRPTILPVRLAFYDPFPYPLNKYLDHINWALWDDSEDTSHLIEQLKRAIFGGDLAINTNQTKQDLLQLRRQPPLPLPEPASVAQPTELERPEGTMDLQSAFYIERTSDRTALASIQRSGVTITLKGPRQMGKSSLLMRIIDAAKHIGKYVAFLDFQLFDQTALVSPDLFFRQFCTWLSYTLNIEDRTDEYWRLPLGNVQRCTHYIGDYVLKNLAAPLVLAMDEADSIFGTNFRSDFFGMLRSWHNTRAFDPMWRHLDIVLVTSTEPYLLIGNVHQSPFNVGEVIEMSDFTVEQVTELNQRHGAPLDFQAEKMLLELLGGHPYLVRRALYLVAAGSTTPNELFVNATSDRGPFGDHLRYHLFRLHSSRELVLGMLQVIHHHVCSDELVFFRLNGAGLVKRDAGGVYPRCRLYADYFIERLKA